MFHKNEFFIQLNVLPRLHFSLFSLSFHQPPLCILAFLLHQPHVYLDQMYGKISKTRGVAFAASANCGNNTILNFDQAVTIKDAVLKAILLMKV